MWFLSYFITEAAKATTSFVLAPVGMYAHKAIPIYMQTGHLPVPTLEDLIAYVVVGLAVASGVWTVPNRSPK